MAGEKTKLLNKASKEFTSKTVPCVCYSASKVNLENGFCYILIDKTKSTIIKNIAIHSNKNRERTQFEVMDDIRNALKEFTPDLNISVAPISDIGGPNNSPLQVIVKGDNQEVVSQSADNLIELLKSVKGITDTRTDTPDYAPQYTISVLRQNANKNILFGIIIESKKGIENLDKILSSPDLDLVYLGAYDISISLGLAGKINHPKVLEVLNLCIEKITAAGKIVGAMYHTQEDYETFTQKNVNFLVYKVDSLIINEGLEQVRTVKGVK